MNFPALRSRLQGLAAALSIAILLFFGAARSIAQDGAVNPGVAVPGTAAQAEPAPRSLLLSRSVDRAFGRINGALRSVLMFDVAGGRLTVPAVDRSGNVLLDPATGEPGRRTVGIPFILAVPVLGSLFFTLRYRWINLRAFWHSVRVTMGDFDRPEDRGEISHFRALASALSGTLGLGNIAGVAIAISLGGPGAIPWMMVAAFFGMAEKFNSCTLGILHRRRNSDGSISGGPMFYLDLGLAGMGGVYKPLGKGLAILYAIFLMGGALGGGNMFQANQTFEVMQEVFGVPTHLSWVFGLYFAFLVGLVVLGGIQRIGAVSARLVPLMCGIYVLASVGVILANYRQIPECLALIFRMAFSANAFYGGVAGVMTTGFQRAFFSNEAGLGSSSIAHSAARTEEPVREGIVAMLEPFIDTMIVCLMTALVVTITGAWDDPSIVGARGSAMTAEAFETVFPWFGPVLALCVFFFAYATIITWCYYGERAWMYILDHFGGRGLGTVSIFRVVFVICVFLGCIMDLGQVLEFSDLLVLAIALPNIIGSVLLAPRVHEALNDYWRRYRSGEMHRVR